MKRILKPIAIFVAFLSVLICFCACGKLSVENDNQYFSYEDYNKAVESGYKGTFADYFISHNKILKFEFVEGELYAFMEGDIMVNLGEISSLNTDDILDDNDINSFSEDCYFHLSFDDTMVSLKNLTPAATYESVFDEPFFAYLKYLHEKYGMKVSLYTYLDVICNVTDKYQAEFRAASSWLKFGLHSTSHSRRFNTSTYWDGYNAWNTFVNDIYRITGTYQSIDRMPRLHYWEGTKEALCGMRDALYGPIGFLTADHEYPSYYLNKDQHLYIYNRDHLIDYKNGLIFLSTDLRIDWFMNDYSTTNIYRKPIKSNIYDELVYRFNSVSYSSNLASYLVFGHEWMYYDGTKLSDESKVWLEDVCRFAYDHNIPFDFPQHRTYYPTPMDIH